MTKIITFFLFYSIALLASENEVRNAELDDISPNLFICEQGDNVKCAKEIILNNNIKKNNFLSISYQEFQKQYFDSLDNTIDPDVLLLKAKDEISEASDFDKMAFTYDEDILLSSFSESLIYYNQELQNNKESLKLSRELDIKSLILQAEILRLKAQSSIMNGELQENQQKDNQ